MRERFDFLVLGGGPSGSAVSTLLARAGARVALIEKSDFSGSRAGEHAPPKLRDALAALGCDAAAFSGVLGQPRHSLAVGDRPPGASRLLRGEWRTGPQPAPPRVRPSLVRTRREPRSSRLSSARASTLARGRDGWEIAVESAETRAELAAKIAIDASGRRRTSRACSSGPRFTRAI